MHGTRVHRQLQRSDSFVSLGVLEANYGVAHLDVLKIFAGLRDIANLVVTLDPNRNLA